MGSIAVLGAVPWKGGKVLRRRADQNRVFVKFDGSPKHLCTLFLPLARLRRFAAEQQEVTWCRVWFGV
jgi:hypothetical protein